MINERDDLVRTILRSQRRQKALRRREALINIVVAAGDTLVSGWLFMLLVGIVHHEWLHTLPTVGYGWSVVIVAFLTTIFSRPSTKDRNK